MQIVPTRKKKRRKEVLSCGASFSSLLIMEQNAEIPFAKGTSENHVGALIRALTELRSKCYENNDCKDPRVRSRNFWTTPKAISQ